MKSDKQTMVLVGLIIITALSRLIPHPFNFTPITAIAVFGGVMFSNKKYSYLIPILAMVVSDMLLGFMKNDFGYAFHDTSLFVYGALALIVWISTTAKKSLGSVATTTLYGSALFFVVSNLGVWMVSGMYPMSVNGLVQCFTMAIPFYSTEAFPAFSLLGNQILGDAVYTGLIFGLAYITSLVTTPKAIIATK